MNNLPEIFDSFNDARREGFIKVKKLKDEGAKVVGMYCAYTPKELIIAAGAVPVSLCGTSEEPIAAAEKHLPRNLCPLIKSSYGFSITDTCPYFYFSDLLVGETTCDGKKKMYEYLSEIKPMHIMHLPQTSKGDQYFKLWKNEMILLKNRLEEEFNVEITEEKIKDSIKLCNEERKVLKEFYELSKLVPPPMKGIDVINVLEGSQFKMDKREYIDEMKIFINRIKEEYDSGTRNVSESAKRILITGCPIGGVKDKIIKSIEENDAVVVCFETCGGAKSIDTLVNEDIEPVEALTEKYLNIPCSCMTPNDDRLDLLSRLIDDYKVDGVIEIVLQACHTYSVESFKIKRFVNEDKNIPYMYVETDYSQTDTGQLGTRIGAFVEMLG